VKRQYSIKAIGLILLLVILAKVDLTQVFACLRSSHPLYLIPVVLMIFPQIALRSLRWQRLMAQQGIACSFRAAQMFYFAGIYIGLITPGRVGELVKCVFLKQNRIAGITQSLPSVLLDRLLDLYVLGLLAWWALYKMNLLPIDSWAAAFTAIIFSILPWLLLKWAKKTSRVASIFNGGLKRWAPGWQEPWRNFIDGSRDLLSPRLAESVMLTVLSYAIYFGQVCLIGQAVDLPISCVNIAMVTAVGILVGYAPVTIAGLGTREATLIFLFGQYGIPAENALSFAFLYNLVYIICIGFISAAFWLKMPHRHALKNTLKSSL